MLPPLIVANQGVGRPQDGLRTAVIPFQTHNLGGRIVTFKRENIANIGTPPTVNRLIRIARDGQVGMVHRECPHDRVLCQVGVLVLVDEQVPKVLIKLLAKLGLLL